jgi:aldose 1-epimerase
VTAELFSLANSTGIEAQLTNHGAAIVALKTPDRNGKLADIVLGFETAGRYVTDNRPHFGATIGRFGNRIGRARFELNGVEYQLAKNNGENSLHGGILGFDKVPWTARRLSDSAMEMSYLSPDGEEGYPGNLNVTVTFTLTDTGSLKIDYSAITDKDTVLNLTNHSYFNLKGAGEGDILDHWLLLNAERFTPVLASLIPTGELRPVAGTPLDFRRSTRIGERIDQDDEQLRLGKGYDHNFVLNDGGGWLALAARVEEPSSGRVLEVHTTEPGVQLYTSNSLKPIEGKGGKSYGPRAALCLETQHFPDSPNQPRFPSTVLRSGQRFHSITEFRFLTLA